MNETNCRQDLYCSMIDCTLYFFSCFLLANRRKILRTEVVSIVLNMQSRDRHLKGGTMYF
jgi:hypothetical protein